MKRLVREDNFTEIINFIKGKVDLIPQVAIVLGSGLNEAIQMMETKAVIPYEDIPYFPVSTVKEHKGRYLFGSIGQVPAVIMQGRVHYYEGYDMDEVVLPIRIMKLLGASTLILTNSAGAVNPAYRTGQLITVKDHISSFVPNCLRGSNLDCLGTRFPDMSRVYSERLRRKMKQVALKHGIEMVEGVYLQTTGPSFETPTEIRMYRTLGADLVGMSTVCEAIAAVHAGMEVLCISHVSNMASGMTNEKQSIEEVIENSKRIEKKLTTLLQDFMVEMKDDLNT